VSQSIEVQGSLKHPIKSHKFKSILIYT